MEFPSHTTHSVPPHTHQTPTMDFNTASAPSTPTCLSVSGSQVKRQLARLRQNKAAGSDGISPRVLRGKEVEGYRYLSVHLDNRLDCK